MSETWSILGSQINGSAEDYFGYAVDISDDGKTVVVGAIEKLTSSSSEYVLVYTFNSTNQTWSRKGTFLKGRRKSSDEQFGYSVGISGDGNTVIVGAPLDDGGSTTSSINKGRV